MKHKRGVSPVIGAVLLIILTVVLAGGVFVWVRNYTNKLGKETTGDALCRDVNYAVGDICYREIRGDEKMIEFNAQNYANNLDLSSFMVVFEYEGGSKSVFSQPEEIESLSSEKIITESAKDISNIKKIRIVPRIKLENEIVSCENKQTIKVWEEIGECVLTGLPEVPVEEYATIKGCSPFLGDPDAPLKILFINWDNAAYFDELVNDAIYNQLKTVSPFKEYFDSMAFYSITLSGDSDLYSDCLELKGCRYPEVYSKISEKCQIDDFEGVTIVSFVNTVYGGLSGEIIYIGTWLDRGLAVQLDITRNTVVHEIGHNFGLFDLMPAYYLPRTGEPAQAYSTKQSRSYFNIDGPGCGKWCNSFKPVSQYTQSKTSQCLAFTDRQSCVSFGRNAEGECTKSLPPYDFPDCCVWSDTKFEYFNTNCVPGIGSENIGIDCLEDSGCFYEAAYGNYAWRPVLNKGDSIMYYQYESDKFDSASERALAKVLDCCFSSKSKDISCSSFREDFSSFLSKYGIVKRVGSCR